MFDEVTGETAGIKVGSGTENHRLRMVNGTRGRPYPRYLLMMICCRRSVFIAYLFRDQLCDLRLTDQKMRLVLEAFPHLIGICLLIRLRTKAMHRRSL